jgi:hypothetical protein
MASYDLSGKLVEIYDTQQVTDTFRKREFVVETVESSNGRDFVENIKFQATQNACGILDSFNIGDSVKVTFNIRGRRTERNGVVNYFNNLEAWRVNKESGSGQEQSREERYQETSNDNTPPPADDLPF